MVAKIIEVIGVSTESFFKAAEQAISEAAKTLHCIRWAQLTDVSTQVNENQIVEYCAKAKIYYYACH